MRIALLINVLLCQELLRIFLSGTLPIFFQDSSAKPAQMLNLWIELSGSVLTSFYRCGCDSALPEIKYIYIFWWGGYYSGISDRIWFFIYLFCFLMQTRACYYWHWRNCYQTNDLLSIYWPFHTLDVNKYTLTTLVQYLIALK